MLATLSQPEQLHWWFPVLMVVGIWLLVSILLGFLSGHVLLLSRFPPVNAPGLRTYHFASGEMRLVSFRNALYVGISARGLHLGPCWLFRPITHRGIPCIPWAELRCVEPQSRQRWWLRRGSVFEIPRLGVGFRIAGSAGLAVEAEIQRASGGAASSQPLVR
jgi:hypothetical protein